MTDSCPISPEVIDDRATRIGAGLVIVLVLASLGLGRAWLPLLLAVDFGLRSRGWNRWSPVAQAAQALRALVGLQPQPTNAGPKRFAALVGAAFTLGIALALHFQQTGSARALAAVLISCAALEACLGLCVGCKVYSLLKATFPARAISPEHP
jgi:hypothetical protein